MAKLKLEYIWLDGYTPLASLRSKTKIIDGDPAKLKLEDLPVWGEKFRLPAQAGGAFPRQHPEKWFPRYGRSAAAQQSASSDKFASDYPG